MDENDVEKFQNFKRDECYTQNNLNGTFTSDKKFCELIFDNILCWPATKAGVLASQLCPNQIIKSTLQGFATKQCEEDGKWYKGIETNNTQWNDYTHWSNYTQCGLIYFEKMSITADSSGIENNTIYTKWVPIIKSVTHFGYGISLITLIIALAIFIFIKKLQCARNKLHMQLFVSFIARAFMSLLKDVLFVQGIALSVDIISADGEIKYVNQPCSWICKAITSSRNYFIIANYMLVLMEGVYLHNLMFLNLFSDKRHLSSYYIFGWGLPLLITIPWVILKRYFEDEYCWTKTNNKYIAMLVDVPISLTVIINFVLFVIIVRFLCVKLNSMYIQQRKLKYRKLARATLILVPLFGVPYIISLAISYYAKKNQTVDLIWLFFDQTFTAFQGFFAALVYCFLNNEVQTEVKNKCNSLRDRNRELKRTRTISNSQNISSIHQQDYVNRNHTSPTHWQRTSDYL